MRFNEIVPRNRTTLLPGLSPTLRPDFVEIFVPLDGDALDLTGYYLSEEREIESESSPIRRPRLWEFPEGSIVEPGGYAVLAFGVDAISTDPRTIVVGTEISLACEGETLYLIGPDDRGNPVVDALSWWGAAAPSCTFDELSQSEADDVPFGRACGRDEFSILTAPTPLEANFLPPLLVGASHAGLISGDPNPCAMNGDLLRIQVEFLVDASLPPGAEVADVRVEFEDGSVLRPRNLRGGALPDGYPSRFPVPPGCALATRETPCYRMLGFVEPFTMPNLPMVRYRVVVEDSCGGVLESCPPGEFCHSIGSSAQSTPEVVVNELNRLSALPGSTDARHHWIELYNPTSETIDLSNASLSTDVRIPRMATFPPGTRIEPGDHLLVVTDGRPLPGPGAVPHVVVDLPWAQIFIGEDRRCRLTGEILLFDTPENGTCLITRVPFSYPNVFPDETVCGRPGSPGFIPNCTTCDSVSLGRLPDGTGG
ncbi:MAG TPA: lamin tail domain-containing protein, partial [Planctomycetota bacterium]|nr:lamin tail domain-containing protein [Planctomycetota bacterium]